MNPLQRISEIHGDFDQCDHELLRALSQKTDAELEQFLTDMIRQLDGIRSQKNPNWIKQQEEIVKATQLMMEYRQLEKVIREERDDLGGTTLA